ncbi:MAG: LuxR C-terminal-related transcriptional regulator [Dehalococcoidia bacterium]
MADPQSEPVASPPLLETKFFAPRWRSGSIARPRLIARLMQGTQCRLTLVSAPAGFGKTALLAEWLASDEVRMRPTAWLSLDRGDSHSTTFWTYVATALYSVHPSAGMTTLALLQSGRPNSEEAIVSSLINELATIADDLTLVLDDFHLVEGAAVHEGLTFLIEHLPPSAHVVIASRADPPLPLARLRARGDLVEVRAADLRFTNDEASSFLNDAMGLTLSADDVARLDSRAEGWIAGLKLAALSMQGRDDVESFIADFTGNDRYVVDYLIEEVLQRQPADARSFLLETSILDRLSGPLCDAVTGREDTAALLSALERRNLFLVPLDDRRQWYRYHHLFGDVLQAHLRQEQSERLPELHRRASRWFEQQGEIVQAIRHAFTAADFERAAGLVELSVPEMLRIRQESVLRGWLDALPEEIVRRRPVLSAGYVGVLLHGGELRTVEARLDDAEHALETAERVEVELENPRDGAAFVDAQQFLELPGMIALYRAGHSQLLGNLADTVKHARRALDLMSDEHSVRGGALALLGLALWASGDLDGAYRTYLDGIERVHRSGYVNDSSAIMLADMRTVQGRLSEALAIYERALQIEPAEGGPVRPGTADIHVGISELYRERGDLDTAAQHLMRSREYGEAAALPENRYRWYVAMAAVRTAEGDLDGALRLLDDAERLYTGGFSPDVRPISPLRARIWLAQGRLADALNWVSDTSISVADDLSYVREFEHITLVRVLIAQASREQGGSSLGEVAAFVDRLLEAAEGGGRTGAVIELLILKAVILNRTGDTSAALVSIERAIALAEPEGYKRVFLDEGKVVQDLLRSAAAAGIGGRYTLELLSELERPSTTRRAAEGLEPRLSEPLTPRELEVLRLVAAGLANQEIADQLVVTLSTVKRHIANSYAKLGVGHRMEAVARANALHLL